MKHLPLLLGLLLSLCCWATEAPAHAPDRVLTGTVEAKSNGAYVEVPFEVPAGLRRITVTFSYTGHEQRSVLDLGIADPDRIRGWSGGNKASFTIATSDATPSYLPGPLPPGQWKLLIGVANMRPQQHATYRAEIRFQRSGEHGAEGFTDTPIVDHPAWYRGDLHMHTAHSDGSCTSQTGKSVPCPVFVTVKAAAEQGLDFVAITDHNTTSHYDAMRELQPYYDKLLLIPGRELTTYRGHANVFGVTEFIDFRAEAPGRPSAATVFEKAHALGGIVSINHPVRPDDERCMGCGWIADRAATQTADAVEVVNSGNRALDATDIAFWEALLAKGGRPTAIGGSDTHRPELGTIGHPTTVVHAATLSVESILDGIRSGHVFVDLDGTHDRLLTLDVHRGQQDIAMGDAMLAPSGEVVEMTTQVTGATGSTLRLLLDGNDQKPLTSSPITSASDVKQTTWTSDGQRHWIRAEVHGADGHLELLGNPIYFNWNTKVHNSR